jgi:hypothetical protein
LDAGRNIPRIKTETGLKREGNNLGLLVKANNPDWQFRQRKRTMEIVKKEVFIVMDGEQIIAQSDNCRDAALICIQRYLYKRLEAQNLGTNLADLEVVRFLCNNLNDLTEQTIVSGYNSG